MLPTSYPELNNFLTELAFRIQQILGQELVGVYLQGSIAVGDYDQHSDVDFIVAIKDELAPPFVDALQVMHDQVYHLESPWAQHLEGSYFPREILRHHSKRGTELWYLDHGARVIIRSNHCNSALVRWVVREKGVGLMGPPPETLVDPVPSDVLKAEIYNVLISWGRQILDNPASYRNRFYQGFIVLSYCRMLHDLYRGYPGSKREGAEWAKLVLDASWSPLIDRAWECRPDPAWQVRQPPDPDDFDMTLRFVEYVIKKSQLYYP